MMRKSDKKASKKSHSIQEAREGFLIKYVIEPPLVPSPYKLYVSLKDEDTYVALQEGITNLIKHPMAKGSICAFECVDAKKFAALKDKDVSAHVDQMRKLHNALDVYRAVLEERLAGKKSEEIGDPHFLENIQKHFPEMKSIPDDVEQINKMMSILQAKIKKLNDIAFQHNQMAITIASPFEKEEIVNLCKAINNYLSVFKAAAGEKDSDAFALGSYLSLKVEDRFTTVALQGDEEFEDFLEVTHVADQHGEGKNAPEEDEFYVDLLQQLQSKQPVKSSVIGPHKDSLFYPYTEDKHEYKQAKPLRVRDVDEHESIQPAQGDARNLGAILLNFQRFSQTYYQSEEAKKSDKNKSLLQEMIKEIDNMISTMANPSTSDLSVAENLINLLDKSYREAEGMSPSASFSLLRPGKVSDFRKKILEVAKSAFKDRLDEHKSYPKMKIVVDEVRASIATQKQKKEATPHGS